jgi:hypothetical protein
MNKKELREQLGAASVAEITSILRDSGREYQSSELSEQDVDFITSVYMLVKQGASIPDAISLVQKTESTLELVDSSKEHYLALANQLKGKLITDGKDYWVAYYECLPDAINSTEVLESSDVKNAREKAASRVAKTIANQNVNEGREFFFSAIRNQIKPLHKPDTEAPQQPQEVAA